MRHEHFMYTSEISATADVLFYWHMKAGAAERMIPPWLSLSVLFVEGGETELAQRIGFELRLGPFRKKWVAESIAFRDGDAFSDIEVKGFLHYGYHTHRIKALTQLTSILEDEVFYRHPFFLPKFFIDKMLLRIFQYRHETIRRDLLCYARYKAPPMRILLSGASGLIGSALRCFLQGGGHQVVRLARSDLKQEPKDLTFFEDFDAVIHLAGEPLAKGRWSKAKKEELFASRVDGTKQLVQLLSKLQHPPKLFLSASAIGYYGSRDEPVTEESSPGNGFLSKLCKEWEGATEGLKSRGIRVAIARFGYVLSSKGGLLHSLLPLFRLGLGMTIASGNQKMSWVSLEDTVEALYHILMKEEIQGAVNITSPHPVSQKVFAKTLAKALARPCVLSLPRAFLIGEKAKELLLPSLEAIPKQLQDHGFVFSYPHLDEYLHFCLK